MAIRVNKNRLLKFPELKGYNEGRAAFSLADEANALDDKLSITNAQSFDPETDEKYRGGHPGDSSLVDNIDYDDDKKELTVKYRPGFYSGSTVIYEDVPREVAEKFISSASKGRFAVKEIWQYKWRK